MKHLSGGHLYEIVGDLYEENDKLNWVEERPKEEWGVTMVLHVKTEWMLGSKKISQVSVLLAREWSQIFLKVNLGSSVKCIYVPTTWVRSHIPGERGRII